MTVPNNPELEALQALVESEGWRLWLEWYDKEWGPTAFATKVAAAVGNPSLEPERAVATLQQTTVALRAVEGLRNWPSERVKQLKAEMRANLTPPTMSRRGPGL